MIRPPIMPGGSKNLAGGVGSGQEVFENITGRVGSGQRVFENIAGYPDST